MNWKLKKSNEDQLVLDHLGITDQELIEGKEFTFFVKDIYDKGMDEITIAAIEDNEFNCHMVYIASKCNGLGSPSNFLEYEEYKNGELLQQIK